jgi:glycosyltransferase involved in cell wall biosynthesis
VKILFISRATLFRDKGGDTIQIVNTAEQLREKGVHVDIRLCDEKIDYTGYRLIHFFNIIRPADILIHIKRSALPYVVSTIYVDYNEYERKMRKGLAGIVFRIIPADTIEYIKAIARSLINSEKIMSPSYVLMGHRKSVQQIIRNASMLLPNSHSEYTRLEAHYKTGNNYRVIPNGIDPELFKAPDIPDKDPLLVICVGRIEGRKNQLNVIRALNGTKYSVVFIGSPSANQLEYYDDCKKKAASNISFINNIPQSELLEYYKKAKVHILASWFETTGLSTLEAAALGCNIVITDKGDTKEYFEAYAWYCDPSSTVSILSAVEEAGASGFNEQLRTKILKQYTWEQAAGKTLEAYGEVTGYTN